MIDTSKRQRVVITGLGAVTALGSSVDQLLDGWMNGRSGVRRITQFDASNLPSQIAGEIPDFNPHDYMDRKEARRIPRSGQIAMASAIQAADAGLKGAEVNLWQLRLADGLGGKGLTIFAGLVADVEAAVEIGISRAGDQLLRQVIIPQLHQEMKDNIATFGRFAVHFDWQKA